jgi:ATP-binding cassette subfamily A (ABC1) protein 3
LVESRLYDAPYPNGGSIFSWRKRGKTGVEDQIDPDVAVSIRNLEKKYFTSIFRSERNSVTAIADLTLDIPKMGIFVLLGSNG